MRSDSQPWKSSFREADPKIRLRHSQRQFLQRRQEGNLVQAAEKCLSRCSSRSQLEGGQMPQGLQMRKEVLLDLLIVHREGKLLQSGQAGEGVPSDARSGDAVHRQFLQQTEPGEMENRAGVAVSAEADSETDQTCQPTDRRAHRRTADKEFCQIRRQRFRIESRILVGAIGRHHRQGPQSIQSEEGRIDGGDGEVLEASLEIPDRAHPSQRLPEAGRRIQHHAVRHEQALELRETAQRRPVSRRTGPHAIADTDVAQRLQSRGVRLQDLEDRRRA